MDSTLPLGRLLFAVGMMAFGVLDFVYADPMFGLEPIPSWIPGRLTWTWLDAALLVVGGACVLVRRRERLAAVVIALLLSAWVLVLHVPTVAVHPGNGGIWTSAFETLALCGAAWVLAFASEGNGTPVDPTRRLGTMAKLGRYLFAVSLPVFCVLHFVYVDYVASVIPAWIPAHRFFAYFTGIAAGAAGLAIVSGVQARLASVLLGVMYGTWVVILHAPRVFAAPQNRAEWTSLWVAAALCGAAFLVAGTSGSKAMAQR